MQALINLFYLFSLLTHSFGNIDQTEQRLNERHCQQIVPLVFLEKYSQTRNKLLRHVDSPSCVGMSTRRGRSRAVSKAKALKSLPPDNDCLNDIEIEGSPSKRRRSNTKIVQQGVPSSTSQMSDDTLSYSLGASYSYDKKDFGSDSDEDSNGDEETLNHYHYISDNTSDEEAESNKPQKQAGKKTMRQTALNFGSSKHETVTRSRFKYSDLDTEAYRKGYPGKKDDPKLTENLAFYRIEISSSPRGDYIDNIHEKWKGDYNRLEMHHGYIQWLFPIREDGMNGHAQALQVHEAKDIRSCKKMRARVVESYRLMLDFYGMKLENEETGQIERSPNWKERFDNLTWSSHNYLRITRILKSLGELGFEHLKKPFLKFVIHEMLVERTLERLKRSCEDYWIGTIKNDEDREELYKLMEKGGR